MSTCPRHYAIVLLLAVGWVAKTAAFAAAGAAEGGRLKPSTNPYTVRLAYFVPRDREPVAGYEQRIRIVVSIVAETYLLDLRGKGYRTSGIRFDAEAGQPLVQLVRGQR